jgi:putative acetyltransferase
MTDRINIIQIRKEDNAALAEVIRTVMKEFDADPETTIIGDPFLNTMYQNYQYPKSTYFVLLHNNKVVGGCGINKLDFANDNTCELQRMFILPSYRGKGFGTSLMKHCMEKAKEYGYDKIYLETLSEMKAAIRLYEKSGFQKIKQRLGNTGHTGCDVCMALEL